MLYLYRLGTVMFEREFSVSVSVAVGRDHYPVTLSPLRTALGHDYRRKEDGERREGREEVHMYM